jgi:hypothetical protein
LLGLGTAPGRQVLQLVVADLARVEIGALRIAQVKIADKRIKKVRPGKTDGIF